MEGQTNNKYDSGRSRCGELETGHQEFNFRDVKFEDFVKFPNGSIEWAYSSLHSGKLFRVEI